MTVYRVDMSAVKQTASKAATARRDQAAAMQNCLRGEGVRQDTYQCFMNSLTSDLTVTLP